MNWTLLAAGVFLIGIAIQIVRLQSIRQDLPSSIQDKMLFGDRSVTKQERAYLQRYGLYGARSGRFLAAVIAIVGIGLVAFAAGAP